MTGSDSIRITTASGTTIEIGADAQVTRASQLPTKPAAGAAHRETTLRRISASQAEIPQLREVSQVRDGLDPSKLKRKPEDIKYEHLFESLRKEELQTVSDSLTNILSKHTANEDDMDSTNITTALQELDKAIKSRLKAIDLEAHKDQISRSNLFDYLPILYSEPAINGLYTIANNQFSEQSIKTASLNILSYLKTIGDYQAPDLTEPAPF